MLLYALRFVLVFLAYFFTAKGGLALDAVSGFATLVWPPAGIALVALLVYGYRLIPAVALAAFLVNFFTGAAPIVALGIAFGNTAGAIVAAYFLRRLDFHVEVESIRDGILFKVFSVVCASIAASIGAGSLYFGGVVSGGDFGATWLAWWVGDILGVLIIGNLLLNVRKLFLEQHAAPRWREIAVFTFLLVFFCAIVFLNLFDLYSLWSTTAVAVYLLSPLLIWSALRFGTIGSSFAIFFISAVAILGTVLGRGPFMLGGTLSENLIFLQIFMGSLTVTTMILATAVTEISRANARLRDANQRMREQTAALSEAQGIAQMGSWQWEVDSNATTCSDELYRLLDFTQESCRGVYPGILALALPEDRKDLEGLITKALATKEPFEFEHQIRRGGVLAQWIRERGRVIVDERGEAVRIVGTAQDITHEKELDRAKTEFLALTSHQLRTPPTGIKWYAAMLLEGDVGKLTAGQRAYLDQIAHNNQRMIDVVDTVLNVSQIELGVFRNKPVPTDVCAALDGVLSEFGFEVKEKEIVLSRTYRCGTTPVLIDPALLRIIAQTLISNAVKYTPEKGTIDVHAEILGKTLSITVRDTGRGIPKEEFSRIFEKFFRASNVEPYYPRGTGLGLYTLRRIVDQMKGTATFSSEVGKGTSFSVSIPVALPQS